MPGEITPEHLSKKVYLYVRQSSLHQVREHRESQHLQYGLSEQAQKFGWLAHNIVVIDDDLGITATGTKKRVGFEKMLSQLCLGDVGALFFMNASRLARNGREWHQVLEFCSIVGCLIIDSDGIYDPRLPGDRFLLGMKASVSEYEVSQFQASARAAILNKASRGELFSILPAGFIRTEDDRIEFDPDRRVQQAIRMIFSKFDHLGTIRQVYHWYQRERLEVPVRDVQNECKIIWRLPSYSTLSKVFHNPLYAGTYQYPKTKTITRIVDGRLKKTAGHRVGPDDKIFLHKDLFPGYITGEKFQQNQTIIANNANMKGNMVSGAPREGKSLLSGLLRCAHCSRSLSVRYNTSKTTTYYYCPGSRSLTATKGCLRFSGRQLEAAVTREIIAVVQPAGIEAAIKAEELFNGELKQKTNAFYHALEQAKYEAERIERQFNAVEPEKYLVSRELSTRWEKALEKAENLQNQYNRLLAQHQPLSEEERTHLLDFTNDLESVWNHPETDFKTKTRLVRLLIKEIWIKKLSDTKMKATLHWHGGVHTEIVFKRSSRQRQNNNKEQDITELIGKLSLVCDDQQIARILNRLKYKTQNNQTWIETEVAGYRKKNNIKAFSQQKYEQRGLINLRQTAEILDISSASVLQFIRRGLIKARQIIKFAPWEIKRSELQKPDVCQAVAAMKKNIPFNKSQLNLNV